MTLRRPATDKTATAETTLPDGLRAVAIGRPGTSTVASKVFLKAGSRHDGDRHGIGHCLEHTLRGRRRDERRLTAARFESTF